MPTFAIDSNLLVRLATRDVVLEHEAVVALLDRHPVLILKTVLLETEWVLRSRYGYTSAQLIAYFEHLFALPRVTIEDDCAVQQALKLTMRGLDFADAMHVAASGELPFLTLDRLLCKRARQVAETDVRLFPTSSP